MDHDLILRRRGFISGGAFAGAAGLAALLSPGRAQAQSGQSLYTYDVTAYGAVGDGCHYDWPGINNAIAAMQSTGGVLYFPPGRYWIGGAAISSCTSSAAQPAKEIQLSVDNTTVVAWGAEIFATADTDNGGLMTVVDRANPSHIVQNVSVFGGLFVPGDPSCNGLCVAQGQHILFFGCRADNTNGQQAFALQVDTTTGLGTKPPAISCVRLIGCESLNSGPGGASGLEIRSAGADRLIVDVVIDGMHIAGAGPSTQAIVCSADAGNYIYGVTLANVSISPLTAVAGTGLYLNGVQQACISNLSMEVSYRGIEGHYVGDTVMNNLVIVGASGVSPAPESGIVMEETGAGSPLTISNFSITGFKNGIWNYSAQDVSYASGAIRNCTVGLNTNPNLGTVYSGIQFECGTGQVPVNSYQPTDRYFKLVQRSGSQAYLIHDDTTVQTP